VRHSQSTWWMKTALLAAAVVSVAGIVALHGVRPIGVQPINVRSINVRSIDARSIINVRPVNDKSGSQPVASRAALSQSAVSLPLYFEPNQGQTDPQVKFLARGMGYGLFFAAKEAVLTLDGRAARGKSAASSVIRMRLDGANPAAQIESADRLPGKSNYFIGNDPAKWHGNIPQFGRVEYSDIYPGINLVYYGKDRQLEYDFRIAPGADPGKIALSFHGASARIDSGDLVLATAGGDVRFRAPRVYQLANGQPSASGQEPVNQQIEVPGSFRLLAENKVGFTVGPYDHSRELVIDPVLNYSSYLGSANGPVVCGSTVPGAPTTLGCPQVAVDLAGSGAPPNIYLAGSTTSSDFPTTASAYQPCLGEPGVTSCTTSTAQNIFIAVLQPTLAGTSQLLYATYIGGSGTDSLAGLAVDPNSTFPNLGIYVAGTTTSSNFPTTSNAFQQTPPVAGTHGFVAKLSPSLGSGSAQLAYSTYLAGTTNGGSGSGTDIVTGLAVDANQSAYVTGTTTSTNGLSGFPSNTYGYQVCPYVLPQSGACVVPSGTLPPQFFASKIDTSGANTGTASMLYSTYFGGQFGTTTGTMGGGVSVDASGYMYFTGTTNMVNGVNSNPGPPNFPIYNATQPCLNQPSQTTGSCTTAGQTNTDAILVKLNPSQSVIGATPFYSTYLGGSQNDTGTAVAVDSSDNAYVTGATNSSDWNCAVGPCNQAPNPPFGYGDSSNKTVDAFIAEVNNQTQSSAVFQLGYFAWLGSCATSGTSACAGDGSSTIGNAISVDSQGLVHLAGQTLSSTLPYQFAFNGSNTGTNYLQNYQGGGDAFVAIVDPSSVMQGLQGDYVTYLGGTGADQATGIAVDTSNNTYVAGTTTSAPSPLCTAPCSGPITGFPITTNAYQTGLAGSNPNAFVSEIGSSSSISVTAPTTSPNPNPVSAGQPATFTFTITNNGPNPANTIVFNATVSYQFSINPTASVAGGIGSCNNNLAPGQTTIPCTINNLAAGSTATVQVVVTPTIPLPQVPYTFNVACSFSVNGGSFNNSCTGQSAKALDFAIAPSPQTEEIVAGNQAIFTITAAPFSTVTSQNATYNGAITFTESSSPNIVLSNSGANLWSLQPAVVNLDGTGSQTITLYLDTEARPVTTGSLFRRHSFFALWLPIGGLSLAGLGIGAASRRRRRWIVVGLLVLVAGLLALQPACSSSSSNVSTNQGTAAGTYFITVTGSSSTNASHQTIIKLVVD